MSETLSKEQLAKEGQSYFQKGDFIAAAHAFEAASKGYQLTGDELTAAEMANNQSVALLQADEPEQALHAVLGTEKVFEQAGELQRQALAIGNQATALEALKRLDEAMEAYEKCADLLQEVGDTENRVSVMQSLSALQLRRGRQLEALATMQAGLNGIKHPSPKQRMLKKLLQFPFKYLNR
jgi:tetratricopeptide (TPR) repeat protein